MPAEPAAAVLPPVLVPGPGLARGEQPDQTDRKRQTKSRRAPPPALDFHAVGNLLLGLEAKLGTLHVVLSEPLFTLADGYAADAELQRQVQAVKWLGQARVPEILRVADLAQSLEDRLVAGAALVYLGEGSGAETMMGMLGKAAAAQQPFPETSSTLFRTFPDAGVLDWLLRIFWQPAHPAIGGLLLPLLAEKNRLSAEQLWSLLDHPKDDVAVEAARALPWTEGSHDVERLLGWARAARTPKRAHALWFAATALGSAAALAEVRARLQADGPQDRLLVEALTIAGGAGDAELLTELAGQADADAGHLLLAAASLGAAETLRALPSFAEQVPPRVLEEARRLLTGQPAPDGGAPPRLDPAVRSLCGQPWSVAGVLGCLGSAGQSLQAQRRMALELRVRTGQAPPSQLPALLPAAARSELLARWASHYAKASGKLRPGGWYYQGKAV